MTGNVTYLASAGDNQVVTAKPAVLYKIIVGAAVGSSVIEISDSATDGDGNLIGKLTGSTLNVPGVFEFNCECTKGICLDLTNQTAVTVIWSPR